MKIQLSHLTKTVLRFFFPALAQVKNTNKSIMLKRLQLIAAMLFAIFTLLPQDVQATHFRYGHLTWQKVSGNTVRFTLVDAFKRSWYGPVNIGDVITEFVGSTSLKFGDGTFTPTLQYVIIAVDPVDDWILGQALDPSDITKTTIDHTYTTPDNAGSPWLAEILTSARTIGEINNPNGTYRLLTYVETNSGNRSPVSGLPALVSLKQSALSQFIVPATDVDPNTLLHFRLATALEAGNGFFNQPAGLTIDSITGLVSWNTLSAVLGGLYSCQVIIEDINASTGALRTQVPVDFLIEIVQCAPTNNAPTFVSPSPTCGSTINAVELQSLTFTIKASDPDITDVVTINSGGLPTGATMTPGLPILGNPVTSVFNWTPAIGTSGNHVVVFTATDDCGQQLICSYTIHVASCNTACNLGLTIAKTATKCSGSCDGSLTANPTKGFGQYNYLWSNGQTTKTVTALCKGIYTVTVTDSRSCTKKAYRTVTSPSAVKISAIASNVKCKGSCTGSITVVASGGSGTGYQYNWSSSATTASIYNLCKGTYTLTVTDSKGCLATLVKTITEPAKALGVTVTKTECSVCLPNCNGTATANPTGGTSPYTYLWSTNATTKKISSLCEGSYTVTVTDKNGCVAICHTTLNGSCCNIALNPVIDDNTNCTPFNGMITLSPVGGSGQYAYSWSTGSTDATISDIDSGYYTVTVTDIINTSCIVTATYYVGSNIEPNPSYDFDLHNTCPGLCDGSVEIVGLDGIGASFDWSNGDIDALADSLCEQNYTVTITFQNGCTASENFDVPHKDSPVVYPSEIFCHDSCTGTAVLYNATDYQSFLWSTGATTDTITGLCAGNYTVTVLDNDGCFLIGSGELVNPDPIIVSITPIQFPLPNSSDGILLGGASGGYVPLIYTLLWSDGQNSEFATGLSEGTYTLTATDSHGCTGSSSLFLQADARQPVLRSSVVKDDLNAFIYPNPYMDEFTINFPGNELFNVSITDYSGRLVRLYSELTNKVILGKDLAPGIYMLKIKSEKGLTQSIRLIKIK